jgi:hypothetical protein
MMAKEMFRANVPDSVIAALPHAAEFGAFGAHAMYQIRAFSYERPAGLTVLIHGLPLGQVLLTAVRRIVSGRPAVTHIQEVDTVAGSMMSRVRRSFQLIAKQLRYVSRCLISPGFARQQWDAARVQTQLSKWLAQTGHEQSASKDRDRASTKPR